MKVIAILLFRVKGRSEPPVLLASSMNVDHFSFFQRKAAREAILFSCRTVAQRAEPGVRQTVNEGEYVINYYNKDGICGLVVTDDAYPRPTAFACAKKAIEDYKGSGTEWRLVNQDNKTPVPCIDECLKLSQDPGNVDKLLRVQEKLTETRSAVETTLRQMLDRGERLEDLAAASDDLGMESKMFAKSSRDLNKCCTIL